MLESIERMVACSKVGADHVCKMAGLDPNKYEYNTKKILDSLTLRAKDFCQAAATLRMARMTKTRANIICGGGRWSVRYSMRVRKRTLYGG